MEVGYDWAFLFLSLFGPTEHSLHNMTCSGLVQIKSGLIVQNCGWESEPLNCGLYKQNLVVQRKNNKSRISS